MVKKITNRKNKSRKEKYNKKKKKRCNKTLKKRCNKTLKKRYNKTIKKKYNKIRKIKYNNTKKKGGVNWQKGLISALALGGPAASANYHSPIFGTSGTQFGSTVERMQNPKFTENNNTNSNEVSNWSDTTYTPPSDDFSNWNDTTYTPPSDEVSNWSDTTYTPPSDEVSNWNDTTYTPHSNEDNNLDNTEINDIIGENKQGNAKENKVFIGKKEVLKTYPKNYEKNLDKALKASEYEYGPKVYKTGRLKDGTGFIVSERLNTVENVEELIENNNKGFKQLKEGLTKMHTHGKHKHGDIHLGNVLYRYDENKSKQFVWNDFDLGESTGRSKSRRKQDLKIEISELADMRKGIVVLGIN